MRTEGRDRGEEILVIVSITAADSNRSSRSMPCGGSKVPTFKVQSKTHAAGKLPRFDNSRNVKIQIRPSLGDDPFRMLASESRRVKPPDKKFWPKYKRLSRLETDYSLILDDFEKNLGRLNKRMINTAARSNRSISLP